MMRILILACCVALAGCQCADCFRNGDRSSADVQLVEKCVVWVSVAAYNSNPDVGLYARVIGPECK